MIWGVAAGGASTENYTGPGGFAPRGIVTGEAVTLELRAARLPSRLLAGAIDLSLVFLVGYLLLLAAGATLSHVLDTALLSAVLLVIFIAAILGYAVAMAVFNGGRTIGKLALGLRVVRDDGGPVAFRQAFTRELVGLVVEKPGPLVFTPAVICSLLREDGKRIGDLAAGTLVISDRVARVGDPLGAPQMPPQLTAWAAGLDLSRLPDDIALRARELLSRAASLRPGAREELGASMVAAVARRVSPPPPGVPGWVYLCAVLAERHRRDVIRLADGRAAVARRTSAPVSGTATHRPTISPAGRSVGTAAYDQPWPPAARWGPSR